MRRCMNCMSEYGDEESICPVCGFNLNTYKNNPYELKASTILKGRYIIGTVLRIRETDLTYIGWDAVFARAVEIQEYFPNHYANRNGAEEVTPIETRDGNFKKGLAAFIGAGNRLLYLYKNPHIVEVTSCFELNNTAYLVRIHPSSQSLEEYLDAKETLRPKDARHLLERAMEAVMSAHRENMIHGSLRADDLVIMPGDSLSLRSFDPAKQYCGNPKGIDYGNYGTWTDVYHLAMLYARMVLGMKFDAAHPEKLASQLSRVKPGIGGKMIRVISEAANRDPRARTQTVREFYEKVKQAGTVPEKKLISYLPVFLAAGAAGLALVVVLVVQALPRGFRSKSRKASVSNATAEETLSEAVTAIRKETAETAKKAAEKTTAPKTAAAPAVTITAPETTAAAAETAAPETAASVTEEPVRENHKTRDTTADRKNSGHNDSGNRSESSYTTAQEYPETYSKAGETEASEADTEKRESVTTTVTTAAATVEKKTDSATNESSKVKKNNLSAGGDSNSSNSGPGADTSDTAGSSV